MEAGKSNKTKRFQPPLIVRMEVLNFVRAVKEVAVRSLKAISSSKSAFVNQVLTLPDLQFSNDTLAN